MENDVTVRARTGLNYLSKQKLIYVTASPIRLNLRRDYATSQPRLRIPENHSDYPPILIVY